MEYNPEKNSSDGYALAIAEMRKRLVKTKQSEKEKSAASSR